MADRKDPFRNFRFLVTVDEAEAGFAKVTGLTHDVEVIEYAEGGSNDSNQKLPGRSNYGEITLERGMMDRYLFDEWMDQIHSVDSARHTGEGLNEGFRKTVVISLLNKRRHVVKTWEVQMAWPSKLEPGDLDAQGNEVLIERLVLQTEGVLVNNLEAGSEL